jgi:hypothetical protein
VGDFQWVADRPDHPGWLRRGRTDGGAYPIADFTTSHGDANSTPYSNTNLTSHPTFAHSDANPTPYSTSTHSDTHPNFPLNSLGRGRGSRRCPSGATGSS